MTGQRTLLRNRSSPRPAFGGFRLWVGGFLALRKLFPGHDDDGGRRAYAMPGVLETLKYTQ
jgi:hypothetical protein